MKLVYETPCVEKLEYLIRQKGYSVAEFTAIINGANSGRSIIRELKRRPDPRSSTLVKICRALDITIDSLFTDSNDCSSFQTVAGDNNIVNSRVSHSDYSALKAENESLKLLVKEKDSRIEDLKTLCDELKSMLDFVRENRTKTGQ